MLVYRCTFLDEVVEAGAQVNEMLGYLFLLVTELIFFKVKIFSLLNVLVFYIQEDIDVSKKFFTFLNGVLNSCCVTIL